MAKGGDRPDDRPIGKLPVPTESAEQQALFVWAAYNTGKHPELEWMYHITNEGKRSAQFGAQLRREGLKRGVPDICLPVPRGGYGALYIELKRIRDGVMTGEQKRWKDGLNKCGNLAVRCNGWQEAAQVIEAYLSGRWMRNDEQGTPERVQGT